MREMLSTTAAIYGQGMGEKVALITDGRFSGARAASAWAMSGPEAAVGGPIALLRNGDRIRMDAEAGTMDVLLSTRNWRRAGRPGRRGRRITIAARSGNSRRRWGRRISAPSLILAARRRRIATRISDARGVRSSLAHPAADGAAEVRRSTGDQKSSSIRCIRVADLSAGKISSEV